MSSAPLEVAVITIVYAYYKALNCLMDTPRTLNALCTRFPPPFFVILEHFY